MGGFQMDREQQINNGMKTTEISASRGGRTYSINFKINFGKMQDEKTKNRREKGFEDSESMDMGY